MQDGRSLTFSLSSGDQFAQFLDAVQKDAANWVALEADRRCRSQLFGHYRTQYLDVHRTATKKAVDYIIGTI